MKVTKKDISRINRSIYIIVFCFMVVLLPCISGCNTGDGAIREEGEPQVRGRVIDVHGHPVSLAVVRRQASKNSTLTQANGRFALSFKKPLKELTVSAWKEGYYCAKEENVSVPAADVVLVLRRYQPTDNPDYEWMPPVGEHSCAACKPEITEVWLSNAHANAAKNPRFLTMYLGTTKTGKQSPETKYFHHPDYVDTPITKDNDAGYYGPGYKLDFPEHQGNCAACHTPGAAVDDPYGTDPTEVGGADKYGVHCDVCHKAADVKTDPETELPYRGMPGVLSMDIRRPFPEDEERFQLFFGTFDDDNVPEEDTKLSLIEESKFCAPCHFGEFWDTVIYNSYGEWLASPYSDPETGETCQDCHMPAPTVHDGEVLTNVAEGKGGVERDPMTIHAHHQLGAEDQEFLEDSLSLNAHVRKSDKKVVVTVELYNDNTGHHIPTGTPLRHMILVVRSFDSQGNPLPLKGGPRLPEWCGKGDYTHAAYAGYPGKVYAKVLKEVWTQKSPTGAYWNPVTVVKDTRLAAYEKDKVHFSFSLNGKKTVEKSKQGKVEIRLILRRAFYDLMQRKEWDIPDMVMKKRTIPF